LNKNRRYRKQAAEGIPALYDLVLLLEFDQRCVSGLVIAIPGTANTAFCMVDAPAVKLPAPVCFERAPRFEISRYSHSEP